MIEFVIWISPTDIDDLENSLKRLQKSSEYLTKEQRMNIKFNIVMGISDEIIDWENSKVYRQECIDKFLGLVPLTTWCSGADFDPSTEISGCTSMRRMSAQSDSDYYIWLDTDIIFDPITLPHMLNAIKAVEHSGYTEFVISPEIVRQWDNTWDCLVNERFIDKPVGYQAKNNPHVDTAFQNKLPTLVPMRNNVPGQPYMKFGGGWFTLLSGKFMDRIPFPEGYGHYGYDDTYLMWGAQVLQDPRIVQFKLKNLIVCENYYNRQVTFEGLIKFIDKREEFKKHNQQLINSGLQKLVQ
jgi:hypothetical protein